MQRPRPIQWLRSHPRSADLLLALGITSLSLLIHFVVDPQTAIDEPDITVQAASWWTTILVILAAFPVYWRRSRPVAATLFVVAVQILASAVGIQAGSFLGVVVALYSLGAHGEDPHRARAAGASFVAISILFLSGLIEGQLDTSGFIASTIILITAYVLGDNLSRRRSHLASLAERAERAEREKELLAQQQVTDERTRIARELHDVVAHSVSVMVIQAAAARRNLREDPDLASNTLSSLESTGRQTMNELRGILGVLRRDADAARNGAALDPQPTLADVSSLVNEDAALPLDVTIDEYLHDPHALPSSVSMTAYRVVQEALTNVRRHAGPVRQVKVTIEAPDDALRITVSDDGRGAAADDSAPGFGLIGMSERVTALGGDLATGPRAGGGWRIDATIPLRTSPSRPPSISNEANT